MTGGVKQLKEIKKEKLKNVRVFEICDRILENLPSTHK